MKTSRLVPLLGGAAAVVIAASPPALAGGAAPQQAGASGSISSILPSGDLVTGVRGADGGNVILTGSAATGSNKATQPFLYHGTLENAAGATVSKLTPPFAGEKTGTFYGPDTHQFNPRGIKPDQVRAVGSYQSSSAPAGVINLGMIYLGPVSGEGGSWTSINVPPDGTHTVGRARACPRTQPRCFVMDTIPHSTMGDLVVGDYDLNPTVRGGLVSANGFIYNITTHQWTLLRLGGSLSTQSTLYGIWQNGGPDSHSYTLAGGSAAGGAKRGLLVDYNERTGTFGTPRYYSFDNLRSVDTHFEGITAVAGGFHLVALSTTPPHIALVFVPADASRGLLGPATWYPVDVAGSSLCSGGCAVTTGNTVFANNIMGLYVPKSTGGIHTYLAAVNADTYEVQPGDCLWTIAARQFPGFNPAGIASIVKTIFAANVGVSDGAGHWLHDPNLINPGMRLRLPGAGGPHS